MARNNSSRKKAGSPRVRPSQSAARGRAPTLREQLEKAAAGLTNQSESSYPFRYFSLPAGDENDLTPAGFAIRLGLSQQFIDEVSLPIEKLVTEGRVEEFLPDVATLADYAGTDVNDPKVVALAKRFQKLAALLAKRLRGVKVLRVGTIEIRCYFVGFVAGSVRRPGNAELAGLVTTSIET